MRFLQKLSRLWLVGLVPAITVVYSLLWSLPNPQTYQRALAATNFYDEITHIAQKKLVSIENSDNFDWQKLVVLTVLSNFSQSQWQDLVEGNILAWTDWLSGRSSNLAVYIPIDQLELVLAKNLDRTIQGLVEKNQLPECSLADLQNLKQGNLTNNFKLCLPSEVSSGQVSFLDFLNLEIGKIVSSLLAEDSFSLSRSRYFVTELKNLSMSIGASLTPQLNQVRDWLLLAKAQIWWFVGVTLLILLLHLWLTIVTNQNLWLELTWLFGAISSRLLGWIVGLILLLGASALLILKTIGVWFDQSVVIDLVTLLLKTVLFLGFYLNWWAVWMTVVTGIGFFLARFLYKQQQEQLLCKNQQLLEYQLNYQQADTFDSQFKQALSEINQNSTETYDEVMFKSFNDATLADSANQSGTVSHIFAESVSRLNLEKSQAPAVKLKTRSKIPVLDTNVVSVKSNVNSENTLKSSNSKKIQL